MLYFRIKNSRIKHARYITAPQVEHRRLSMRQAGSLFAEIHVQGNVSPSYKDFQALLDEAEFKNF